MSTKYKIGDVIEFLGGTNQQWFTIKITDITSGYYKYKILVHLDNYPWDKDRIYGSPITYLNANFKLVKNPELYLKLYD